MFLILFNEILESKVSKRSILKIKKNESMNQFHIFNMKLSYSIGVVH